MGDGGRVDRGSAVIGGGRDACVGSGGVNDRDCCRIPGSIRELWEDLPYSFLFFLIGDVSLVKSQRSVLLISSLVSISMFYSVTFVIVEGS